MTTIKFHFRSSTKEDRQCGTLYVRVIHERKYRDIGRPYGIRPEEWDSGAGWLRPDPMDPVRHESLRAVGEAMRADLLRLESVVNRLSRGGGYSVVDIVEEFHKTGSSDTVFLFAARVGRELGAQGRVRTARAYRSAARSFAKFNGGGDVMLSEITAVRLRDYERYLLDCGLQMNTISFYMRNLRALYYRAVGEKIIQPAETNPFEHVYTGVFETKRRALDQRDINSLAGLQKHIAAADYRRRFALLYFLFAYHGRGMSFIDLAFLKKTDLKGDSILYKRRKTGFFIEVKVTKPMKKIIDGFKAVTNDSPYLFPIIDPRAPDPRIRYESELNRQNKMLKELAAGAGIEKNLSTHVARHTWATLAKRMGYGINLISEGLGHRDTKVTSIYLASFERSALDDLSTKMSGAVNAA